MFQVAIGRLGSRIVGSRDSLDLYVYIDAGGRASENRVWGGLAVVGDRENVWIATHVEDLRSRHAGCLRPNGELKGSDLSDSEVVNSGRKIRENDRRILFWANWYPEAARQDVSNVVERYLKEMKEIRADQYRLDRDEIDWRYRELTEYFENLKGINKYKTLSILAHFHWLVAEIERVRLGSELRTVSILVDREDFPAPSRCAELLKLHIAAELQAVGMSVKLTGRVFRERYSEGAITIDVGSDSSASFGLELTDVLIQAVQRRLPGYSGDKARS